MGPYNEAQHFKVQTSAVADFTADYTILLWVYLPSNFTKGSWVTAFSIAHQDVGDDDRWVRLSVTPGTVGVMSWDFLNNTDWVDPYRYYYEHPGPVLLGQWNLMGITCARVGAEMYPELWLNNVVYVPELKMPTTIGLTGSGVYTALGGHYNNEGAVTYDFPGCFLAAGIWNRILTDHAELPRIYNRRDKFSIYTDGLSHCWEERTGASGDGDLIDSAGSLTLGEIGAVPNNPDIPSRYGPEFFGGHLGGNYYGHGRSIPPT
jgi:hypothetical protein